MIHSLAGGDFTLNDLIDFAKVEILQGIEQGKQFWYVSQIADLKVGDIVLVPFGIRNERLRAKVVRIDKKVSRLNAPIPLNRAKEIFSKIVD